MSDPELTSKEIAEMRQNWHRVRDEGDIRGLGDIALGGAAVAQEQNPEPNDK